MFTISFTPFFIILLFPLIPESYRWYLSRGYHPAGVSAIKQYTKKCGKEIDEDIIDRLVNIENDSENNLKKGTMVDLFTKPVTCITTLKMVYLWVVITMVYYSFALGRLPGFIIVNNIINGIVEIGTMIPMAIFINKPWFYRSKGLAALLFMTGAAALLCGLMMFRSIDEGNLELFYKPYALFINILKKI